MSATERLNRPGSASDRPFRTRIFEGDFASQLSAVLLEEGASGVVCARKRRTHHARLIFEHRLLESVRDTVPVDEVEET